MSDVPRLWQRWRPRRLPPVGAMRVSDRIAVFAEILVAYAPLLVRVRGNDLERMVALARAADPPPLPAPEPPVAAETAVRLGKMVLRTLSVLPTDKRCLIRSLVLVRLLDQRSIRSVLVIGVETDGGFAAHAWVECADRAVLPPGDFHRLLEL